MKEKGEEIGRKAHQELKYSKTVVRSDETRRE
jgi:hypothetical protein